MQQAAKVKIYTEQLQRQKLTLDDMGCMINHGGQGALDSKSRRRLRAGLRREGANQGFTFLAIWKKDHVLVIYTQNTQQIPSFCINAHKSDLTLGERRVNYVLFILKECVSLTTEPPVP